MRSTLKTFLLPLLIGFPGAAIVSASAQTTIPNTQTADATTTVRWNRLVPKLADQAAARRRAARAAAVAAKDSATLRRLAQTPPQILFRIYGLLSTAQYAAVTAAHGDRNVSSDAAVASASASILTKLYTDSAVRWTIADELARDIARVGNGPRGAQLAEAGRKLGDDVAARVGAWAPPELVMFAPYKGTIPTGPGMWYSAKGVPPIGIMIAQARPWLLDSVSQFRPGPPPAYTSAAFQSALDEVRSVAKNRTREQTAIAQYWNDSDPWSQWNQAAADALNRHHSSDLEAARVFAVLNVGAVDAVIACFDAKYHYWTIRPSQADTTIVLADSVDLPNFPSYPSGHACTAGAFDGVLSQYFPSDRAQFTKMAEEQAMSRLYGGIHYRFDDDVGLALGRTVARYAVEREKKGALNAWRDTRVARKP
jgi:hypothetical protein